MTTSTLSSRNIASKDVAIPYMPVGVYTPWQRPSDWLTLPSLSSTVKFVGLMAVYDDDNNYVVIGSVAATGSYTIDWGDGTSDTTSGAITKSHKYTYSSLSSDTLTTRGYRQAIVTITVNTGTFDGINLTFAYSQTPALPQYNTNWLDINVGSATLGTILIGNSSSVSLNILENINVDNCIASPTINFQSLLALQQVTISSNFAPTTTFISGLFSGCSSLIAAPEINTSSVTNMANMFLNCISLRYVPPYDTSNVTTTASMFSGCTTLRSVPQFNTAKVTSMANMFQGCVSLPSIPFLNTSNVTTLTNFADGCFNLLSAPMLDTSKVNTMYFMFNNCYSLTKIPQYNTSNCLTTTSMFANCISLPTIPVLDTAKVTNSSSMYAGCARLKDLPNLNYNNVTNATSMFSNCTSLVDLSGLSTPNITIGPTTMFSGCTNLVTLPETLNYSSVNTGTFVNFAASSTKLRGNISLITGTSVSLVSAFTQCQDLTSVSITSNNLTTIATTFNNCRNLRNINFSNLALVTTTGAFSSCVNLSTLRVPNLGVSFTVASTMLSKDALETVFTDLRGNATAQTVTITSCQGADTVRTISSGTWANNGRTITFAGAPTNVAVGMVAYGTNVSGIWRACTVTTGTNQITVTGININAGTPISFNTTSNGINQYQVYYVMGNPGVNWFETFQITDTKGGTTPVTITSSGSKNCQWDKVVTDITGNVVTVNNSLPAAGTATSVTFRYLNTYLALLKNWAVTG